MNITLRKLALLEKTMDEQEQRRKIEGFSTPTIDLDMKKRISDLMEKVRKI